MPQVDYLDISVRSAYTERLSLLRITVAKRDRISQYRT